MILPKYYIPKDLENAIKNNENNEFSLILTKLKRTDCLEIAECHYLQLLKLGLYLEEYQRRKEANQFQIREPAIEPFDNTANKFKIYVENLNEDTTILTTLDLLKIYDKNDPDTVYTLKVADIRQGYIIVNACDRFCQNYTILTKYETFLIFNNYWFKCCHYSLSRVSLSTISCYFFPKKKESKPIQLFHKEHWFNSDILNNPEQKQAVISITKRLAFPAPYILYGPPGTGKTSTIVEAICQIWNDQVNHHILVCTPSNAASDVITKRLLDYIPAEGLFRVYSKSQQYSTINEDIRKCCNYNSDGTVDPLRRGSFSCKKIIITTLCTSLRLEEFSLHFSHMFIDEAGQATQAEALLPLCAIKSSICCQIVLSGDHQQLGPTLRSELAEPILGQSILGKLMKEEPYVKSAITGYNSLYITKLIRNYRSNEIVIHTSNFLFYNNELIASNKEKELSTFPVVFHAVEGKEQGCSGSTSSYNEDEIDQVLIITKNFVGKKIGDKLIRKEDIGIVTPFVLQASKIRKNLDNNGLKEVVVGTVETFQGQEREIIIVSTVRTKTFINDGVEHIGFLSNPKRFNVALSRAKTFLVVVGNPGILQIDKHWRYFLRFCQKNYACHGESFVIKNDTFYSSQELSTESKITKSTDLFDDTLEIFNIDDGVEVRTPGMNRSKRNISVVDEKKPRYRYTIQKQQSSFNSQEFVNEGY